MDFLDVMDSFSRILYELYGQVLKVGHNKTNFHFSRLITIVERLSKFGAISA